jgi:hypothetical protein
MTSRNLFTESGLVKDPTNSFVEIVYVTDLGDVCKIVSRYDNFLNAVVRDNLVETQYIIDYVIAAYANKSAGFPLLHACITIKNNGYFKECTRIIKEYTPFTREFEIKQFLQLLILKYPYLFPEQLVYLDEVSLVLTDTNTLDQIEICINSVEKNLFKKISL